MSRQFKFWISVFALNLVPIVGYAEVCDPNIMTCGPAQANESVDTSSPAAPAETALQKRKRLAREKLALEKRKAARAARLAAKNKKEVVVANEAPVESPLATVEKKEEAAPKKAYQETLTVADAKETFVGNTFEAVIEGSNPNNRARLFGRVYAECAGFFEVFNTNYDKNIKCANAVGFTIRDVSGKGRDCQAKHKGETCSSDRSAATFCVSVSDNAGSKLDLSKFGDVAITLVHLDLNRDRDQIQCESLDLENHIGAATIALESARLQSERRSSAIKADRQQVAGCGNLSSDERRDAAARLASKGALSEGEFERLLRNIDLNELKSLEKRALTAPLEDLPLIEEDLLAWSSSHCDDASKIAPIFHKIALRYSGMKAESTEGHDLASEAIGRAQSIECLDDKSQARLENFQRDIAVGRCSALASQGLQNNFLFGPCYSNLMMGLQQDVMKACSGRGASLETCSSAMTALRATAGLPQRAGQVDQQRAQMQQQINQALAQAGGGGMPMQNSSNMPFNNGVPGLPTFAGNSMPISGGGTYWAGGQFGGNGFY